jgi:tetratricopeptide (TPR) repeat protein
MRTVCILLLIALSGLPLHAADLAVDPEAPSASTQFDVAYQYLLNADQARDRQNLTDAATLYKEAAEKYQEFAEKYPHWQPGVVKFRLAYCKDQLENVRKNVRAIDRFASTAAAAATTNRTTLGTLKTEAALWLRQGEAAKARMLLLDALKQNPDDIGARLMSAIAQCQAGQFEDATYVLQQIVEEEPSNAAPRLVLGAAAFGMGQMQDAAAALNKALELDPRLAAAHYNLAQVILNTKPIKREAARQHYRKWIEMGGAPDPDVEAALK